MAEVMFFIPSAKYTKVQTGGGGVVCSGPLCSPEARIKRDTLSAVIWITWKKIRAWEKAKEKNKKQERDKNRAGNTMREKEGKSLTHAL